MFSIRGKWIESASHLSRMKNEDVNSWFWNPAWSFAFVWAHLAEYHVFLHDSIFHLLTGVSVSPSYETVASMLGPSGSVLAEVDLQACKDKSLTLSKMDAAPPPPKVEDLQRKHTAEYPPSAEPYMWDLKGRTETPSPATDSDDGFLICASMKKWPPLTAADISEITKDTGEEEATPERWSPEEGLGGGQDPGLAGSTSATEQPEAGQSQGRAESSSSVQDKG